MRLSLFLLAKSKAEHIVVRCRSVATGYPINKIRVRLEDKLEFMAYDPLIQKEVLFKEEKKVTIVQYPSGGALK